ncbi:TIR domain-containing adapter molecule 1 [Trematomus bernacchii]|uniref:TIR domain-containing adapter molecule 1 n=1 Tax=Trematomus bernacchii TaxID=40690 RepID=UPI00146F7F8C|nr:TIR domain-containing adapter molecule 1 [Trematomus bernacchii]XP_033994006.1 TIR domain-containing adapter molecule 1 [Trematomus bernacchii]
MSHVGQESQGTGLRDVFDIVIKASPNRLLSLTFQLGESPEDNIIHALCLIVLQKEGRALNKLQMLKNNFLAQLLAEKWQMSEGKLEDFATRCGHLQEFTGESLALLARIFKVLSEQRLCDTTLRNLAYKRALSSDNQKSSNCEYLEYDQFREEAKVVCGPQFAEWLCSSKNQMSEQDPHGPPDKESTTLKVDLPQDQSERAYSLPSPLQATSSMPSYPTHLEISLPPTASYRDNRVTPETSGASEINTPAPVVGESQTSQPESSEPPMFGAKKPLKMEGAAEGGELDSLITRKETLHQTSKPTTEPTFALPTATSNSLPKMPAPKEVHESEGAEVEEEPIFYAFVIFHAAEDADVAESMKERLEEVMDIEGATFGEFAVPGRSTLRSVEDAINNSAYTVLLLTRNFDRMQMMEADSALVNSIYKKHKDGTVIPLLPRENSLPKDSFPMVLKTINTLDENRNFERKVRRVFSPTQIKKQRDIWNTEQKVKMQMQRQETLKNLNRYQKQLIRECTKAELLQKDHLRLLLEQELHLGPRGPPEQPQIHINNAKYIMIGNDSRMNVGSDEHADRDDSINRDEDCS